MTRDFVQRELFKPFVSTKAAGFGLGAFEALQLAQAMGGTIEVASEAGKGSCFALRMPHADAGARSAEAVMKGASGGWVGGRDKIFCWWTRMNRGCRRNTIGAITNPGCGPPATTT